MLKGKVALVTGAASGIGQAIAVEYARHGAHVIIVDRADAGETAKSIADSGGQAHYERCDLADETQIVGLAQNVGAAFGKLDILVNNAGIYSFTPIEEATVAEWDHVFAVNARGAFLTIRNCLPLMKEAGAGKIINIASAAFFMGAPFLSAYTATKGALIGLSRSLAAELAPHNIQVNVITPGIVETAGMKAAGVNAAFLDACVSQQCIKRLEQVGDLAGPALFLASAASDFMTGQIINIDGGLIRH